MTGLEHFVLGWWADVRAEARHLSHRQRLQEATMGGKPSKGTKKDGRLKGNSGGTKKKGGVTR